MSLAALRLGFAMGNEALVEALFAVKDSFNSYPADLIAQKIGEIAIKDTAYYQEITRSIIRTREFLSKSLKAFGWQVLPSHANFIFAGKKGVSGETVYQRLREEGILVRHFNTPGIEDFIRITIGTEKEIDVLLSAMKALFP
jgi:histidinol-phosphate aminotransferase